MPDVFISYSRRSQRNMEFRQQLVEALKSKGKDPWFDQCEEPLAGIAAGAPWWKEIQYGIENAVNFLFVISPESIISPYCHAEIYYAREWRKPLVPVLDCGSIGKEETEKAIKSAIEAISDDEKIPDNVTSGILNLKKLVDENWRAISAIQYVTFSSSDPFEQSLERLIKALDDDLAWKKIHSQLMQAAKLWEANNFDDDYLWGANRLKPVHDMIERRKPELDTVVQKFIEPEQNRLLREINDPNTTHQRRSAIGERLAAIGDTRPGVGLRGDGLPDIVWCPVLRGEITLKDNAGTFQVHPFYIAKYPITYVQFQAFLNHKDMGFEHDEWWQRLKPEYKLREMREQVYKYDNHPRENVSWYQAVAFCRWLTVRLPCDARPSGELSVGEDWIIRLPMEWEWQLAATGGQMDYEYPWGKEWDASRANNQDSGVRRTTAVGMYPGGISLYNVLDMSGNVWEWCLNEGRNLEHVSLEGNQSRVLRGGSYANTAEDLRVTSRPMHGPVSGNAMYGFRVVLGPPIPGL